MGRSLRGDGQIRSGRRHVSHPTVTLFPTIMEVHKGVPQKENRLPEPSCQLPLLEGGYLTAGSGRMAEVALISCLSHA